MKTQDVIDGLLVASLKKQDLVALNMEQVNRLLSLVSLAQSHDYDLFRSWLETSDQENCPRPHHLLLDTEKCPSCGAKK